MSDSTNGGRKLDAGKPLMSLVSTSALLGLGDVLTFGAKKYAADNWRGGMAWRRVINSLLRHGLEFSDGKDIDEESGLPVIDHLGCCWMFLSEYQKRGLGTDDRFKLNRQVPVFSEEIGQLLAKLKRLVSETPNLGGEYPLASKDDVKKLLELLGG